MKKGPCLWSFTAFIKPLIACSIDIMLLKGNAVMFCTVIVPMTFGEVFGSFPEVVSYFRFGFWRIDVQLKWGSLQTSQQHWGWLAQSNSKIFCTNPAGNATRCWHSGNAAMSGKMKLFGWYTPWRYCGLLYYK